MNYQPLQTINNSSNEKTFTQVFLQNQHLGIQVSKINAGTFFMIEADMFANDPNDMFVDKVKLKFHHTDPDRTIVKQTTKKAVNKNTGEVYEREFINRIPHELCAKLDIVAPRKAFKDYMTKNGVDVNHPAYANARAEYTEWVNGENKNLKTTIGVLKTNNHQSVSGSANKAIEYACFVCAQGFKDDGSYVISLTIYIGTEAYLFIGNCQRKPAKPNAKAANTCVGNFKWKAKDNMDVVEDDDSWD